MYKFEDTLRTTGQDGGILPAEALAINGKYLDEVIPGFNTLTVSGRELLTRSVTTKKVGNSDGEIFMDSTHPTRTITVKFQLVSKTPQEFRKNFEQLTKIIDQPEAELSFHDDESVFYVGTHVQTGTIPDGKLNVIATMTFQCSDPKAHAKNTKTATNNGTANQINFKNAGTDTTPVTVTAKMKSDNGFLGLALNGRAYQVGVPNQVDGVILNKSELLVPGDPMPEIGTGELNKKGFEVMPSMTDYTQMGSFKKESNGQFTAVYGTGTKGHGPSLTYRVPNDSDAHWGAKNYTFRWHATFGSEFMDFSSVGQICATLHDSTGKALASITYSDMSQQQVDFNVKYCINGKEYFNAAVDKNKVDFTGHAYIIKNGAKFTFRDSANPAKTYNCDELKDSEVCYVSFAFMQWGTVKLPTFMSLVNWNFTKDFINEFKDTPNYFKNGDVVILDSDTNTLTVNGFKEWDRVDIGSKPLLANVGDNTLGIVYSDWAKTPEVTVDYRERWL
ncbi:distal tail protein Dit [Latilactobacillus curvatus]